MPARGGGGDVFFPGQSGAKLFADFGGELGSDQENAGKLAAELLPPDQPSALDFDEFGSDDQLIAAPGDSAKKNSVHVQLAPERPAIHWLVPVAEDRAACQHAKVGQPGERGDDGLGEAVDQIVGIRVGGGVLEGQHGNGLDGVDRPRGRKSRLGGSAGGSDEPVAATRHGFDEDGSLWRVTQRVTEPFYGRIEALIEVDVRIGGPERLPKLLTSYHLSGTPQEKSERIWAGSLCCCRSFRRSRPSQHRFRDHAGCAVASHHSRTRPRQSHH